MANLQQSVRPHLIHRYAGANVRFCRGQDPRFSVLCLPPARPERNKMVNLPVAIGSAAGEVNMHAILDRLGIVDRHEDMPTGAFSPVPMTISFSRSLSTFQPSACVQNRARPGQARQIMSINDDVVQSCGHVEYASRTGPAFHQPRGPPGSPDASICRGQGRAPRAQRALGRRARLVLIKKTFQRRNVSLVFRTLHLPLEIQHMTQADKRQAVYNIRLGDLLGDRRLSRPS